MKAESLRIGNKAYFHLNFEDKSEVIITPQDIGYILCNVGEYSPIPLTEQKLLDYGFKKVNYEDGYVGYEHGSLMIYKVDEAEETYWIFNLFKHCRMRYLHELQNLYYSLYGEELVLTSKN